MKNNNDSLFVSSLRNRRTELDPDSRGAESVIVSGCTPQLEFDAATNRRIYLLEVSRSKVYNGQADWLDDIEENLGTIRKQETLTVH